MQSTWTSLKPDVSLTFQPLTLVYTRGNFVNIIGHVYLNLSTFVLSIKNHSHIGPVLGKLDKQTSYYFRLNLMKIVGVFLSNNVLLFYIQMNRETNSRSGLVQRVTMLLSGITAGREGTLDLNYYTGNPWLINTLFLLNLDLLFLTFSVQVFQPIIKGNSSYHHWLCISIYRLMSYPLRSLYKSQI